jgi:hypothetical protein
MKSFPAMALLTLQIMSDRRDASVRAISGEECMLVDEEYIYGKLHILLELNQLAGDLDHTLNKSLCISSSSVPFHLEN